MPKRDQTVTDNQVAEAWRVRALSAERALADRTPESIQRHRNTIEALEPYWYVA